MHGVLGVLSLLFPFYGFVHKLASIEILATFSGYRITNHYLQKLVANVVVQLSCNQ